MKEANKKKKEEDKKIEQEKRQKESENIKKTTILTLFKYAKNINEIVDRSFKRYKLNKRLKNKKKLDDTTYTENNKIRNLP